MKVSDKLRAGIPLDASQVRTHDEIRAIAKSTQLHPFSCKCEGCLVYNEAMAGVNSNKATTTPDPTVGQTLAASFKAVTRGDGGGRSRPTGHTVKVEDESKPPKKTKKTSEKLLDSLVAKLK